MKFNIKHQGNIFYLVGYLVYIGSRPDASKLYLWIIGMALACFSISLFIPLFNRRGTPLKPVGRLTTLSESAGSLLTLLFAVTFIPQALFIETHLALFGLLVLTFLATRNILPGLAEENNTTEDDDIEPSRAISLPANK